MTLYTFPYTTDGLNSFNLSNIIYDILSALENLYGMLLPTYSASAFLPLHNIYGIICYVPLIHSAFISATVSNPIWHDMSEGKKIHLTSSETCSPVEVHQHFGGSMFLQNIGGLLPDYMPLHLKRQ